MMADESGYYHTPSAEDKLAMYIKSGCDLATFETLLKEITDLDGKDGQLLRLCAENDAYLLAKNLYLRGADMYLATTSLQKSFMAVSKPAGRMGGYIARDAACNKAHEHLNHSLRRMEKWKKIFSEDVTIQVNAQRLKAMEEKIDALHAALAELSSQRVSVTIKKPDGPQV